MFKFKKMLKLPATSNHRKIRPAGELVLESFRGDVGNLKQTRDWFLPQALNWLWLFEKTDLANQDELNGLEIGSWEGLSSYFILSTLPNLTLTCVDPWDKYSDTEEEALQFAKREKNFDCNTKKFGSRVNKYKGTSWEYFTAHVDKVEYDLIYIDGSHFADDVLVDALKSFERLKVGGLMIFDDYKWDYYQDELANPQCAIDAFLKLKAPYIEILLAEYQVAIVKTARSNLAPKSDQRK